jgi:hypothetical protein
MVQRALDAGSGRVVPVDDLARTHFGAQRAVLGIWESYSAEPRVSVFLNANRDNALFDLSETEFTELLHLSVDDLQELGQFVLDELRSETVEGKAGSSLDTSDDSRGQGLQITEAFYEAAKSRSPRKRPGAT